MLQAPHRNDDLLTGKIALQLLRSHKFWAVAWNTVSRNAGTSAGRGSADLVHRDESYLHAFTRAWLDQLEVSKRQGELLQLHGFAARKHRRVNADVILSSGSYEISTAASLLHDCLEAEGVGVALFPIEANELGGTTNTIGHNLRNRNHHGFLHFEMNKPFRTNLLESESSRQKLVECLP